MIFQHLPNDVINIILDYNGRIKYRKGIYTDIIHKHDFRYNMIKPIIQKKQDIIKKTETDRYGGFYFEFGFDICNQIGLCYDYNFSFTNRFEICYYDTRNGWEQIRTYL